MKYLFIALFSTSVCYAQNNSISGKTITLVDNTIVHPSEMKNIDPNSISYIHVYKDEETKSYFGEDAKDGIIYIETKSFSKDKFQHFFKKKSEEYKNILEEETNDSNIQYIHNGKILNKKFESILGLVDDTNFKSMQIFNAEELKSKYNISDKKYGVLILSDPMYSSQRKKD